jgi:hydroxymethylbilane synthase
VAALLKGREPALEVELVEIVTRGDKILDAPLARVGGKGLFVREIEDQLLRGEVDLAVHSLKDLPSSLPEGLIIAAVPVREDPRDALVSKSVRHRDELRRGARIGTSSLRRACQMKAWRNDLEVVPIRGNVQTRLRKIDDELDAGILALAGLRRLAIEDRAVQILSPEESLPAVGQGALAIEARVGDERVRARVEPLTDPATLLAVTCERAFLAHLCGSCQVPIAAHAALRDGRLLFRGLVGDPDGTYVLEFRDERVVTGLEAAVALGTLAAENLLSRGAAEILSALGATPGAPES